MFENFYLKSEFDKINVIWIILIKITFDCIITEKDICFVSKSTSIHFKIKMLKQKKCQKIYHFMQIGKISTQKQQFVALANSWV